jgi:DNA polymerase
MSEIDSLIQQITTCTLCALSEKRTRAVPGEGSLAADIVFIGEGPGYYEDRDGRPFVGPAGQLLDQMLASIGLKRPDVYITNMVKCRPPNNRDPLPGEIAACKPYLDRQLELIRPKVLVTLGRYSLARFFPGQSISQVRGKPRQWTSYVVYPMYHPAAALHNPGLRSTVESDFRRLPSVLEEARRAAEEESVPQPQQLTLFSST